MQLEVNQEHKKIKKPPLQPSKRACIAVGGTLLVITLYSGALPMNTYAADIENTAQVQVQEEVEIPEFLLSDISNKVGKQNGEKIEKTDLEKVTYLYIGYLEEADMSFLKYCTNLEKLFINVRQNDDLSFLKWIPNLKSLNITFMTDNLEEFSSVPVLESVESLQMASTWSSIELTKENQALMDNFPNLKKLSLMNSLVAPGWEEKLNELEELVLYGGETYDIDFKKLTNLKKLTIKDVKPYTIAIFLSIDEYTTLQNAGVEIEFASEEDRKEYLEASGIIEEIVKSLEIDENSTDQEKLDAILVYVLGRLEYDPEIKESIANNTTDLKKAEEFYEKGKLYGALEKETAICGNYAALVEALMDRVSAPNQSTIVTSSNHAWNYIKVDGELYLVDATWLDGKTRTIDTTETITDENGNMTISISFEQQSAIDAILEGAGHELRWYMEDISEEYIETIDEYDAHKGKIPSYMKFEMEDSKPIYIPVEQKPTIPNDEEELDLVEEEVLDITDAKVKIKFGKKEMIISGGALVGIMLASGAAIAIKKKKELKRLSRMRQQSYHSKPLPTLDPFSSAFDDPFSQSSYTDPFSDDYIPRR